MRYPYRCPICDGATKVQTRLYQEAWEVVSLELVACRSCIGTGVVWSPDDHSVPLFSVPNPSTIEVTEVYPCTCPQELKDGKVYVGDNFCQKHGLNPVNITSYKSED